jgi:hypothetical protein
MVVAIVGGGRRGKRQQHGHHDQDADQGDPTLSAPGLSSGVSSGLCSILRLCQRQSSSPRHS